jgi:anti-anti-sigma factor
MRLRLSGEIDLGCRDRLRNRLIALIEIDRVDELLVDLDRVDFLDCSGIGALVAGRNAAVAAGRGFQVRNPHGIVTTLLHDTGVDVLLGVNDAPAPTVGALRRAQSWIRNLARAATAHYPHGSVVGH